MFRVALISHWHGHSHSPDARYAKEFLAFPGCSIVCVWDSDEAVASDWAKEYNADYSTDLEAVIARDDVDGLIVTSKPADHMLIFSLAAKYKKHVFTEKVLSLDVQEAVAIQKLVHESGIKFAIAFTRIGIPQLAYAKEVLESGALGRPVMFRCLCGHAQGVKDTLPQYWYEPELTGGGAMIDMGFNSAYLAQYIMGDFESVSSSFSYEVLHKPVEDCASCNVRFRNGAMGLIDATFDSPCMSVFELAVYGTKGSYYTRFGSDNIAQLNIDGKPLEEINVSGLAKKVAPPVTTWANACINGGSLDPYGIDNAVKLVRFMKAAYESYREDGKRIRIE